MKIWSNIYIMFDNLNTAVNCTIKWSEFHDLSLT